MRTTIMTPSTPTRITRTITTRAICTSEHSSALLVVFPRFSDVESWSSWLKSFTCPVTPSACLPCCAVLPWSSPTSLSTSTCPSPVFFHSSVLMHPDLHTDPRQPGLRGKITCATPPRGAFTPTTSPSPSHIFLWKQFDSFFMSLQ